MTYVLISLPAYRQLKKVAPDLITTAEREIQNHLSPICDELDTGGGTYLFASGAARSQLKSLAAAVWNLILMFNEYRNDLQGYAVGVLDEAQLDSETARTVIRRFLSRVPPEDGGWTDRASMETLSRVFELQPREDYWKIEGLTDAPSIRGDIRDFLLVDPRGADRIHKFLSAPFEQENPGGESSQVCFVHGGDRIRIRRTIESVLEALAGNREGRYWLETEGSEGEPFERPAIADTIRTSHERYGSVAVERWEEDVWERVKSRVSNPRIRYPFEADLRSALEVVLHRYVRHAASNAIPAVWVMYDFDRLDDASKSVLEDCLENVSHEKLPVIIATTESAPVDQDVLRYATLVRCDEQSPANVDTGEIDIPDRFGSLTAYHYLYHRLYGNRSNEELNSRAPTDAIVHELPESARDLAFVVIMSDGAMTVAQIGEFLKTRGILDQRFRHDGELLAELGFLISPDSFRANPELNTAIMETTPPERAMDLKQELAAFGARLRDGEELYETSRGARLFAEHQPAVHASIYQGLLRAASDAWSSEGVSRLFEMFSDQDNEPIRAITNAYGLRIEMMRRQDIPHGEPPAPIDCPPGAESAYADLALASAEWRRQLGALTDGLDRAKRALMLSDGHDPVIEARANVEIGTNMLASGKLGEAQVYFENAADRAERSGDQHGLVHALLKLGATLLLDGNLSRASRSLEKAQRIGEFCGAERVLVHIDYLFGRIDFELGDYGASGRKCLDGLNRCDRYEIEQMRIPLYALLIRAEFYQHQMHPNIDRSSVLDSIPERPIIRAESRYFAGDYTDALETLRNHEMVGESEMSHGLFAPLEGLANIDVLARLRPAFELMLAGATTADPPGVVDVAEMLREERLNPHDPHNGQYCFFFASGVSNTRSGMDLDYLTSLSRATKYVQERAARIDDASIRRQYTQGNYWNRRIIDLAREHKLV